MRPLDLAGVVQVESSAYEYPWSKRLFRDCLRVGYECFVLADTHRIGAHAVMQITAGEAHLLNLCVARDLQGNGYGRLLLGHLLALVRRRHAMAMFLEVRPTNEAAKALYLAEGFAEVGRRPRYYPAEDGREDALVMSLDMRWAKKNPTGQGGV